MIWFGLRSDVCLIADINLREVAILSFAIGLGFVLGLAPGLVF